VIQHWDYFSACIYTPQEYARDQKDFHWALQGKQFSYNAIFAYFKRLAIAQNMLLKERMDIRIFTGSLRHLFNLSTVKLSFHGAKEDQLLWFAHRIFLSSGENSLLVHLEAILRGVVAAQDTGLALKRFEIDGMHSKLTTKDSNILEVAKAALAKVESLKLIDSPRFLEFLSSVPLPSLRRLELEQCWSVGLGIKSFLQPRDGRVLHAFFKEKNQVYHETWNPDGHSDLQLLLEASSCSGNIDLRECLLLIRDDI
jgi:hypothetical protein